MKKYYLYVKEPYEGKRYVREDTGNCYHREHGAFFDSAAEAEAFAVGMYPRGSEKLWRLELDIRSL